MSVFSNVYSQEVDWNIGVSSFFDNSEFGHSKVQIPQTMAGVHLIPEAIFRLDQVHSIHVGVDMLHEFGSNAFVDIFTPTAYYQYKKPSFKFLMGAYPRKMVVDKYPRFFFQDSITYYRPNMTGLLLEYSGNHLYGNLWLDWTSRQSPTEREAFIVGFSGEYKQGIFVSRNFSYMYHFAGVMNPVAFDALHDNILSYTSIGVDLSGKTPLDKLSLHAGWAVGLDRARDDSGWFVHHGLLSEATVQYKWFGVFNTLYRGDSQMYYYNDHGNELYWGDPIYRAKLYNRTDLYVEFMNRDIGSIRFVYSLHACEHELYQQQVLRMSFNIGNERKD